MLSKSKAGGIASKLARVADIFLVIIIMALKSALKY